MKKKSIALKFAELYFREIQVGLVYSAFVVTLLVDIQLFNCDIDHKLYNESDVIWYLY